MAITSFSVSDSRDRQGGITSQADYPAYLKSKRNQKIGQGLMGCVVRVEMLYINYAQQYRPMDRAET